MMCLLKKLLDFFIPASLLLNCLLEEQPESHTKQTVQGGLGATQPFPMPPWSRSCQLAGCPSQCAYVAWPSEIHDTFADLH